MSDLETVPFAIIGGGVIGLSVAINLAKKFGPNSVYLFEKIAIFARSNLVVILE